MALTPGCSSTAFLRQRQSALQRLLPPLAIAVAVQWVASALQHTPAMMVALVLDAVVAAFLVHLLLRVDRPWRHLLRSQGLAVAEPIPAGLVLPSLLFTVGIPLLLLAWPDSLAEKRALLLLGSVASVVLLLAAFAVMRNAIPLPHAHRVLVESLPDQRGR